MSDEVIYGQSERVLLRPPRADDEELFLASAEASRELHRPWVSPPADAEAYAALLARVESGRHLSALVVSVEDDSAGALVGVVNANEIVRGLFQSAYLGYYAFAGLAGRGLFREGLALFIDHLFTAERLHRLEANIQPENRRSRRLVEGLGFVLEGYSRRYLKIDGRWRDHERWAILAEDWWAAGRSAAGGRRPRVVAFPR